MRSFPFRAAGVLLVAAILVPGRSSADGLPPGALARLGPARVRQPGVQRVPSALDGNAIRALVYADGGKTLITAGEDATVRLWDVGTGTTRRILTGHRKPVCSLALSPDGKTLVSVGEEEFVRVWVLASGKELRQLGGPPRLMTAATFSPAGKVLVAANDGVLHWDPLTGKELPSPVSESGAEYCVAVSGDGKIMATGVVYQSVSLWDAATGERRSRAEKIGRWGQASVTQLAFSPSGKTLASVGGVWETATGKVLHDFHGHHERFQAVAFTPDGRTVVTASRDRETEDWCLILWEVSTGKVRLRFRPPPGPVCALAVAPDGRTLASGHGDGSVLIWDVRGDRADAPVRSTGREPAVADLTPARRAALWADLVGADAERAYQAMHTLAASPRQALPLLREMLREPATPDAGKVKQFLADLDDDRFAVRERASAELTKYGVQIEGVLFGVLRDRPSAEVERRVKELLERIAERSAVLTAERRTEIRILETLERMATQEARRLLETLGRGPAEAELTQEARESLGRLARQAGVEP